MSKTPDYYKGKYKGIEAMDVVLDFQEDSYNLGVAIAYLLRAGHKPNNPKEEDIEKAIVHLQTELKHLRSKAQYFKYFENHSSSAKTSTNGMAVLYKQIQEAEDWLSFSPSS